MMTRREFNWNLAGGAGVAAMAGALSSLARAQAPSAPSARPNIVLIVSDQHSHKFNGFAGHPIVSTPNLDRIAAHGAQFRNAYCNSPVCTPSRTALATGMYASDCNSFCNASVWDGSRPTWATSFRKAGYRCFATGKLDLNPEFDSGFEESVTSHGHSRNPDLTAFFRRPLCMRVDIRSQIDGRRRTEASSDVGAAQRTIDFIRSQKGKSPWAAYCGLYLPHPPFVGFGQRYDDYESRGVDMPRVTFADLEALHPVYQQMRHFNNIATPVGDDRIRRARIAYYAMISEVDEYVGRIWEALEETGALENTVFVYTSDHGECLGEHGLWSKNNLYDVSARVPLIMAGAGVPRKTDVETPVSHVDLVRTLLELAGAEKSPDLRGHSLLPLMRGEPGDHPGWAYCESHCEGNATGTFMVREGDWKYIHFTWYPGLLFNVKDDPDELNNRIADRSVDAVRKRLEDLLHSHVDPMRITEQAFLVQTAKMKQFMQGLNDVQLLGKFQGRLGRGQAAALLGAHLGRPLILQ